MMQENKVERLWPNPTHDTKPYWDGLLEGKILIQQCSECGTFRHYPRPVCPECYSMDFKWREATGHGAVHSWSVSYHAFHPAFKKELPTAYITVDLPEGVRLCAPLRDSDAAEITIGKELKLGVELLEEGLATPIVRFASKT
jgi:uncharacterized OB-fold protein